METFTHLLIRSSQPSSAGAFSVVLQATSVSITDKARFAHRGVLIDTARHFLPVSTILAFVDAMAMNKFNVLHWHTVDAESFPLDVREFVLSS
jgi:hexosaminidase